MGPSSPLETIQGAKPQGFSASHSTFKTDRQPFQCLTEIYFSGIVSLSIFYLYFYKQLELLGKN